MEGRGDGVVGLGREGGTAEFVAVPARHLVPLGEADPIPTSALAVRLVLDGAAVQSRVTVVGIGIGIGNGSPVEWAFLNTPYECELAPTSWGTVEELHEVARLCRDGRIEPLYTTCSLDDALQAYRGLEAGKIAGRAVVVPHGHA